MSGTTREPTLLSGQTSKVTPCSAASDDRRILDRAHAVLHPA
jgi:hypothetical protein